MSSPAAIFAMEEDLREDPRSRFQKTGEEETRGEEE